MTTAAETRDPALSIGALALNDCRTVCRALKLRAAELTKVAKKYKELDRHNEAKQLEGEAADIQSRLGPKFDEQGTFNFAAGPNEKKDIPEKKGRGRFGGRGRRGPQDLAEEAHQRIKRGGK
jgi:hypothetical protein